MLLLIAEVGRLATDSINVNLQGQLGYIHMQLAYCPLSAMELYPTCPKNVVIISIISIYSSILKH